ncbi:MAG: twin-arginine translocation signal domain-containing protein [Verrucomicrobia bacterium]|nr:twin-arginine translocation signal domain-containing protein [Verrucomicrobiota bacterium]
MRIPKYRFPRRAPSGRTPLFSAIRRAFSLAIQADRPSRPPVDELIEIEKAARVSRREFLKMSTAGALAIGATGAFTSCVTSERRVSGPIPRVAIVGAGMAGLNAAYRLKLAGLRADVFEASKRSGGRMYTAKDILAPGLTTELGGEFIDSNHEDMLALVKDFNLELLDVQGPGETELIREAYFFDGSHHTERKVVEAFRPIAARLKTDFDKLGDVVDFEHEGGGRKLDNTTLDAYLNVIGATGWLRELLEVAFVTEYGLEANEQSALNMLFMISTDLSKNQFEAFGESDERYKVAGGNQRIVDELAQRVSDQIRFEHRLAALRRKGDAYVLHLSGPSGATVDVEADFVVLCLPFTLLREVELQVELPKVKRKAIAELGYGNNTKVMLGFHKRIWRDLKYSGNIFTDEPYQLAWDNSRLQPGTAGGLTCYSGGRLALTAGQGTPSDQAKRLLPGVEKAFPGVSATHNGKVERFDWPRFPWTKGSYACYKPGQWTTIAGSEIKPVKNLFFAGEHCSTDFQGFMNGAAETGRGAAESILAILKKNRTFRRNLAE